MADSATVESHSFQAETQSVLNLVINSLYTHKEVFLRELISNASDALDKARVTALTEHDLLGDDTELKLWLSTDEDAKTLTISDNGIGMSHDELVENLGTIAKSGSRGFVEALSGEPRLEARFTCVSDRLSYPLCRQLAGRAGGHGHRFPKTFRSREPPVDLQDVHDGHWRRRD